MSIPLPPRWSVVEGGAPVRSGTSLSALAVSAAPNVRAVLLRRLYLVDPFLAPSDHTMMQLSNCVRAVRELVADRQFDLTDRQAGVIVSIYEAGLLAGYDGVSRPISQDPAEGLASAELLDVFNSAWKHGNAVKERWRSYAKLISAMFGSEQLC